jgi:5'-nucleotidase (lipoprotein e(P4) family)
MVNTAIKTTKTTFMVATAYTIGALVLFTVLVFDPNPAIATAEARGEFDRNSIVRALLWMRTSGEYEALCRQTFNVALERVRNEMQTRKEGRAAAVIMDLDETVLDNSGYSFFLLRNGLRHHETHWNSWNRQNIGQVGLVPGAKQFIKAVENEGVRIVFVSNRSSTLRDTTQKILLKLDVATEAELADPNAVKLLLRQNTSSKQSRRDTVMSKYDVIALLGDNLNDFSSAFRSPAVNSIDERRAAVQRHTDQWGIRWFVLPNPIYGYWTRYINWDEVRHYFEKPER